MFDMDLESVIMNWRPMNVDIYVSHVIQEISTWVGANIITISIITNVLQWLKKKAIQSNNVDDDKIITFLLDLLSFEWLRKIGKKC